MPGTARYFSGKPHGSGGAIRNFFGNISARFGGSARNFFGNKADACPRSGKRREKRCLSRPQDHSLRSATTGSRLAAAEAGNSPEMSVSTTLTATMMSAPPMGSAARPLIPVSGVKMALMSSCSR